MRQPPDVKEPQEVPEPGRKGKLLPFGFLPVLFLFACGVGEGQTQADESPGPGPRSGERTDQEQLPPRGEAWVILGGDTVRAEMARTPEERERGLMHRESLADGRGMLFVFPDIQIRSFWMKDTLIPLDIAYLDENLRIVDIQGMEPGDLDPHPSAEPAMFALEVPLGWFERRGIGVGEEARIIFGPG